MHYLRVVIDLSTSGLNKFAFILLENFCFVFLCSLYFLFVISADFLNILCMISDIIIICIIAVYIMYKMYEVLCDFVRNLQKTEG